MIIKKIHLYKIDMKLLSPFSTSYGTVQDRELILLEVEDEQGFTGWGEVVAFSSPWYTEETIQTCFHMLDDFLIPSLLHQQLQKPEDVQKLFKPLKRNNMAKAALDCAVWDLYAKRQNKPLSEVIGGVRAAVEAGVVVGLNDISIMKEQIKTYMKDGYKRFKVKIKPGADYELLKQIRDEFPSIPLMADANSAYTLSDSDSLKKLDELNLMMIEQPLSSDDILDHRLLQKQMKTPICLDESIVSYEDARHAVEQRSCKIINVKIGRVGGISVAKQIHDLCAQHGVRLWVGGMLEAGISRAHNIALATLPSFTIPGDISASSRYWEKDIIKPEVEVEAGVIKVKGKPGIGYDIDKKFIKTITAFEKKYK
ncbi:o-succinylbenzoate synthase [Priestia megaterium]